MTNTMPPALKAAFARVRWQVIATMSDGSESIVNCMSEKTVESTMARNKDIIAEHARRGYGFSHGPAMISTRIELVERTAS